MSKNQGMHFKECSPEETVKKLKGILQQIGVEVEVREKLISEIGTHSMRIVFKGTDFGTNGKGVSESYCTASAYAEFFERYQNDLTPQWRVDRGSKFGFKTAFDERILSTSEVVADDNPFINYYFTQRSLGSAAFEEKVQAFEEIQRADFWQFDLEGEYITLPFYDVKDDRVVFLPRCTYSFYYGSNGMCAGNTPEEALVQGLSEIFERVAQKRIFIEKPTLPDVPDEYIKQFPYVYDLLTKLRSNENFLCTMKDCSFGGKYPVAALVILEKDTGKMGVKLGCHPDYGIAMERAITEAAQGSNIYKFVDRSFVDFHNTDVDSDNNICNSFKVSAAQFPYQIIGSHPTYEFTPSADVSELTNAEILKSWIHQIIADGYDVLVRDVSSFGFPSFHIIIPGLSELQDANDLKFKALNTKMFVQILLLHPEQVNKENVRYIISTLKYFRNSLMENNINQYFSASTTLKYPGEEIDCGFDFLLTLSYAIAEDYSNAENLALKMYQASVNKAVDESVKKFYLCLFYYFSAISVLGTHNAAIQYLKILFREKLVSEIDSKFSDVQGMIGELYPCNYSLENDEKNPYNIVFNVREKLFEAQVQSKIDQRSLRALF